MFRIGNWSIKEWISKNIWEIEKNVKKNWIYNFGLRHEVNYITLKNLLYHPVDIEVNWKRPDRPEVKVAEVNMNETGNGSQLVNETISSEEDDRCGYLNLEKFEAIQNCSFWVEGVAMAILGFTALVTNGITIYGFSRYRTF